MQLKLCDKDLVLYLVSENDRNGKVSTPPMAALTEISDFPSKVVTKAHKFIARTWASPFGGFGYGLMYIGSHLSIQPQITRMKGWLIKNDCGLYEPGLNVQNISEISWLLWLHGKIDIPSFVVEIKALMNVTVGCHFHMVMPHERGKSPRTKGSWCCTLRSIKIGMGMNTQQFIASSMPNRPRISCMESTSS